MGKFEYKGNKFYKNGEEFRVLSGTVQYFRILPEQWEDRLLKLKACGLNTVETYSCWNLHERKEGQFDFSGRLDLAAYLDLTAKLGLNVIFRPGPYICAEWDMGALPSWLLTYPGIKLRCSHPVYLEKVQNYLNKLFEIIRPRLISNGGNIIMMQIENEYGAYGDDKEYLNQLKAIYEKAGMDCLYFTADWTFNVMSSAGKIPGAIWAGNFGGHVDEAKAFYDSFAHDQPFFDSELWTGWFDNWFDEKPHKTDAQETAGNLAKILDYGGSANLYVFCGGTNFGFNNGANLSNGKYLPTVTSYDFDAVISECGDLTPKYYAIKKVLEERFGPAPEIPVSNSPKASYGKVNFTGFSSLWDNLPQSRYSSWPLSMEELGQDFGYVLYEAEVTGPIEGVPLTISQFSDRAIIYADGNMLGIFENLMPRQDEILFGLEPGKTVKIQVLIENMGRINFGDHIDDSKGMHKAVHLADRMLFGWKHYSLPMEDFDGIEFKEEKISAPGFLRAELDIDTPCDTFLDLPGLTKGFAVINGFNLGRYWKGSKLYVPAPLLRKGKNELIVFESDEISENAAAVFSD